VLIFNTDFNVPTGMTLTANVAGIPAGTTVSSTENVTTDANQDSLVVTMSNAATQNIAAGSVITFYDAEFYNNYSGGVNGDDTSGWYVDSINTDLQQGGVSDFIEKEGRWYNNIRGEKTTYTNAVGALNDGTYQQNSSGNIDPREFSFQGVGVISASGSVNLTSGSLTGGHSIKIFDIADADVVGVSNPYTVNDIVVDGLSGAQSGSHVITITPDAGVFLQASDFIAGNGTASSGTTFTHGTNDVSFTDSSGDTFVSTVTFANTATAQQLAVGYIGNTITVTVVLNGFTITTGTAIGIDIDLATTDRGTNPTSTGFGTFSGRVRVKTNKYVGQDHTLVAADDSSSATTVTAFGGLIDGSWDNISYQQGTVTSNVSSNTTIGIDEDIASSLTAGANGHFVRNANNFVSYGLTSSISDQGSTTNIVFAGNVDASEDDVLQFYNANIENSGIIGSLQALTPFEYGITVPLYKFTITAASNFHIAAGTAFIDTGIGSNLTSYFVAAASSAAGVTTGELYVGLNVPSPELQQGDTPFTVTYEIIAD